MLPPLVTCYPINWPCCALKMDLENTSKKVCSPQVKLKAAVKQSEKWSLFWLFHWKTFFTHRKMFVLWILNWNLLERTFGFCSLLGIGKILTRALLGHCDFSDSSELPSRLLWAGYTFFLHWRKTCIWLLFHNSYHLLWLSVGTSCFLNTTKI